MSLAAVVCLAYPAYPVDPNRTLSQYIRDHWGVEQGFIGGSVTSFAQTPDGYLWIGTEKGLIRFDGLTFRLFQQASPTPLSTGAVQALVSDVQGNLWILLQNTRILRYNDGKFELGREEAEFGITSLARRGDGTVLFSSVTLGALTNRAGRFEVLTSPANQAPSEGTATTEADNRNTRFSWATQLVPHRFAAPNSVITSIAETTDGKVWLGTQDKGLFYMSKGRVIAVSRGQFNYRINCLLALENGELWVGTDRGIVQWNGAELTSVRVPSPLRHSQILSLLLDHDANLWVGTAGGLIRVNADGVSVERRSGAVTALFEDREGNLWIGTAARLERLRDSAFITYSAADLKSQSVGALYVDSADKAWFAPSEGGLRWRRGGKSEMVGADGLGQDIVYSISSSGKNELWVGRQRGGLTRLTDVNGSITPKTYTQSDGLPQGGVYAVHQSRDGSVWSATLSGGVSEYNGHHFTTYTTANGLASNRVSSIAEGTDGTMWFGTPNGLSELRKNGWRTYSVREGLSSLNVNCLLPDSKGILWIGTANGLSFLSADHIHAPQRVPDSLREAIFGMAEDSSGNLWVATANHILQVTGSSLLEGTTEADVREYGLADGLSGTEGVQRSQSVVSDSHGRVWFSTNGGLSFVDPARAAATSTPVLVHIEGVARDGTALDLRGPVHFPPGTRRTTFRYVGLSLSNSERVRYRYRLDGVDRGWSEAGTNREATYNNLGTGKYRFHVIASNSYGRWNDTDESIDFSVLPEFYQTNWFRMSCGAAFFAFLWGIYQLRVQQLRRQFNVALDACVNERMRIARELHDTLLQTLHGLMFRFQAARNLFARRPGEALEAMDSAIKRTEEAIAESRDAIKDLRVVERATSADLGDWLTATGQELETSVDGDANCPTFRLMVGGERQELSPAIQDEVYRIGRELLRNAFLHAHAHRIEAEVRYDNHALILLIRDDGKGIDPAVVKEGGRPGHWGLPGIRERAKQIQARLDFWTENGAGTEVQLTVPGSVAYKTSNHNSILRLFRGEKVS